MGALDVSTVAFLGAGAIGGTLAACSAAAGHDVCVIDADSSHVDAIRAHGLRVDGVTTAHARLPALLPADAAASGPYEAVVLAVGTSQVAAAFESIRPHLTPAGVIVTLQNGLAAETVARLIGEGRVLPGSVSFAGVLRAPGQIAVASAGPVHIGEFSGPASDRARGLAEAIGPFGPVTADDNVWGFIWAKLAVAAVLSAFALDGRPNADILADDQLHPGLASVLGCVAATASALGVPLQAIKGIDVAAFAGWPDVPSDLARRSFGELGRIASAARATKPYSGVRVSLAEGRAAEPVLTSVIAKCRLAGVDPDPLIRVDEAITAVQEGRARMSPELLRLTLYADRPADAEHLNGVSP
jgi:2-dehydropantoate 2-reductase